MFLRHTKIHVINVLSSVNKKLKCILSESMKIHIQVTYRKYQIKYQSYTNKFITGLHISILPVHPCSELQDLLTVLASPRSAQYPGSDSQHPSIEPWGL